MGGLEFNLLGNEIRLHDMERVGLGAVPGKDGHEPGAHGTLTANFTSGGLSLGLGGSGYIGSESRHVGGNAHFYGPILLGVWAGGEAEVLRDLQTDNTEFGVHVGAFALLPPGIPIFVKAGVLDVADPGHSWAVTIGVGGSFELMRSP